MGKKVNFILSAEVAGNATGGVVLGEFNNWSFDDAASLNKQKDGSLKATATLEFGKTYQYRYLLNDGRWVNDEKAEAYVHVDDLQVENCVITVPQALEAKAAKVPKAKKIVSEPDDLTKIEGIGKKIAGLLTAADIISFKDLSKASVKKLKTVLDAAGSKFNVHDPATWPQQAKLAVAGKWDELEELQKTLVGGK